MSNWNEQTSSNLSSFSDNPELRKAVRRRRIKWLIAICLVVLLAALAAKPAYRAFRRYQIARNLEAAQVAMRLEDWTTARTKARSVLLAERGNFEAFRIWTRALGHLEEPRTYMAAASLFMDPRASRDDKLEALKIMARQAPEAVTLRAYGSLPEEIRNEREFLTVLSPFVTRRGGSAVVIKQLTAADGVDDDPAAQLELLRAYCAHPTEDNVVAARVIFAGLVEAEVEQALEALVILGNAPGGLAPGEPLPRLREWVTRQSEATTIHHLLALNPSILGFPEAASQTIEDAVTRFGETDPGVLGTWLIRLNRADKAFEILEESAQKRSDAYLSYLHALMKTGKDEQLKKALAEPPASADLVEMELVRAVMARRRGDKSGESAAWARALNHAAIDGTQNRFIQVARYATALGAKQASADAWVAAVRLGWGPLPLYSDLQPQFALLANKGNSADILAMCQTLLRFEPGNPDLINNYFYLSLIHELIEPGVALEALESLVEQLPERPEYAASLAMALLATGDGERLLELMPTVRESKLVPSMMFDALEGSGLVLVGRLDEAKAMLKKVDWKRLLRQEQIAFRRMLLKKEVEDLPLPDLQLDQVIEDPAAFPEWRKAIEKLEKARSQDTLPALPALEKREAPELPE